MVRFSKSHFGFGLVALIFVACSAPNTDYTTEYGRQAIYYSVNQVLNKGDCTSAIEMIEPVYNSEYSEDQTRELRAAAHACRAGVDFFGLIGDLASADMSDLFQLFAVLFPSGASTNPALTATDAKAESAWYAADALMAWLKPGMVIPESYRVSSDENNLGSMLSSMRDDEANFHMVFVSMATLGVLNNQFGEPDVDSLQGADLPWSLQAGFAATDAVMNEIGCSYASAILNLGDSLTAVAASANGKLDSVKTAFETLALGFDAACEAACTVCGISCTTCPATLRHRGVCTTPEAICSAAALVSAANAGWGDAPP